MKFLNMVLILLSIPLVFGDINTGFPEGFWAYGDWNHDGRNTQSDVDKIRNLDWLLQWNDLIRNASEQIYADKIVTKTEYLSILKEQGILRVMCKRNCGKLCGTDITKVMLISFIISM